MAKYAGLTDDPERRKGEHKNPSDWVVKEFSNETDARNWEKLMHFLGYEGDTGGAGWHYGYTFTLNSNTKY